MTGFVRWVIFIFIGYPFQILFNCIYPLLHIVWRFREFSYIKPEDRRLPQYSGAPISEIHSDIRDSVFCNSTDDHNALEHYGLFFVHQDKGKTGLEYLIYKDGAFLRRFFDGRHEGYRTSGDCVVTWSFAYSLLDKAYRPVEALRAAAKHYLWNLGAKSNMWDAAGWVSSRCNNFGLNYCPDGWKGLGQPMAGPQFWVNSAVLALASRDLGWKWKAAFWAHFWLMGGPLWVLSPQLYTRKNKLGYSRDIVMKALWCHLDVFGARWWVTYPMKFIHDFCGEGYPALFEAMLGRKPKEPLPKILSGWHSQSLWGDSNSDREDIWIPVAVEYVRRRAQQLGVS